MEINYIGENRLCKWYNSKVVPVFCGIIILALFHFRMSIDTGDASWFLDMWNQYGLSGLPAYLSYRWEGWTSRLLLEAITLPCTAMPYSLWKLIDFFMWVVIFIFTIKIFYKSKSLSDVTAKDISQNSLVSWLTVFLLIQYSFEDMNSAGWISTCIVYAWTAAAGIFSIYSFQLIRQQRIKKPVYLFSLLTTIFACNTEQLNVAIIAILFLFIIECLSIHNSPRFFIPHLIIAAIEFFIIILCPGNAKRVIVETANYLPAFSDFTVANKLYVGYARIINHYFFQSPRPILITLTAIICFIVFKKRKDIISRCLGLFPLLLIFWNSVISKSYFGISSYFEPLNEWDFLYSNHNILYVIISLVFIITLCIDSIICLNTARERIFMLYILAIGFGTALMMGFSPTVYASSNRTFFFMELSLIYAILYLSKHTDLYEHTATLLFVMCPFTILSVLNNMVNVAIPVR